MRTVHRHLRGGRGSGGGFVLLAVLVTLLALLVLCAPFLATARNADRASGELADRARARIALDGAARHARAKLGRSHGGYPDETPLYDDDLEVDVPMEFDPEFLNPLDTEGVMWDLDVEDVTGKIDLNSAAPEVIANLFGTITRLQKPLSGEEPEFAVYEAGAFGEGEQFAFLNGELLRLGSGGGGNLSILDRAVGTYVDDEGNGVSRGPRLQRSHGVGAYLVDQRAHALAIWRLAGQVDEPRSFTSIEQVREAGAFAFSGGVDSALLGRLAEVASVHAGVRGGTRWQKPVRLVSEVLGDDSHEIAVDDPRWINSGSTVRIRQGEQSELRYVLYRDRGRIGLDRSLEGDYDAFQATVEVLARRPVNVNTANMQVLVALFSHLKLYGQNSRITEDEAAKLAELVLESRPFTGFEDFLKRVVLPASDIEQLPDDAPVTPAALSTSGGAGILDVADAVALYLNALNANDARLEFSTMPLAFTSRDVFAMDLRVSVNAKSGIERMRASRERVELVVPQRELFTMWSTQADFDEVLRLTRDANGWATGPESTSRWDGGVSPPSRAWANLGTARGGPYLPGFDREVDRRMQERSEEEISPERVFASREQDSWAQLWPVREPEVGERRGRMLHFDHETRDLEGRYLPDQPVYRATDARLVQWTDEGEGGLMKPFAASLWVEPLLDGEGHILDAGGTSTEADRVSLVREGDDVVFRVLDGFGDHPLTSESEVTEARLSLTDGEGPGLPLDTWSHFHLHSTGTRPSQTGMLVNGLTHGVRRPGLTRLVSSAGLGSSSISVESTEGFPAVGPVRIGNEIIECQVVDDKTLEVRHNDAGPLAGFGGRLARTRYTADGEPLELEATYFDHPVGASVEVYGYSAFLSSVLPPGAAPLPGELGQFRVAQAVGVAGGLDIIQAGLNQDGDTFQYGEGYDANNLSGLILVSADNPTGADAEFMEAFSPGGGYAAVIQQRWGAFGDDGRMRTTTGTDAPTGGVEIIRYSGWSGTTLTVAGRGSAVAGELENYGGLDIDGLHGGSRAFVIDWDDSVYVRYTEDGGETVTEPVEELLDWATYVVPISLPAPSATDVDFLAPRPGASEIAQITRPDAPDLSEWVRYDTIQPNFGQLVRDSESALNALYVAITVEGEIVNDLYGDDGSGGPPDGGGGESTSGDSDGDPDGGSGEGAAGGDAGDGSTGGAGGSPPPPPTSGGSTQGALWDPIRGEDLLDEYPISRAVWSQFQFRGVLGTFPSAHPAGSLVLPVFRVLDNGIEGGRPGARDAIFAVQPDPTHLGWPLVVHRAHLPSGEYVRYAWKADPGDTSPTEGGSETVPYGGFANGRIYVGLEDRCPEPIIPREGDDPIDGEPDIGIDPEQRVVASDPRLRGRLVKWPSGERPRTVAQVAVGGGFDGENGTVPAMTVDEILFESSERFRGLPGSVPASHTQGASLVLAMEASEGDGELVVFTGRVVAQSRYHGVPPGGLRLRTPFLAQVGEEIVCVTDLEESQGLTRLRLAAGGRAMLGSLPQAHQAYDLVVPLDHMIVTTLTSGVGGADPFLPIGDRADEFPGEGLVLIGSELVHYTRRRAGGLEMPQASGDPGADDEEGIGLFRGRFGTAPSGHGAQTPVILFPHRYPDRWAERADVPELTYFGFQLEQPGAWWSEDFWDAEEAGHGQCRIGVLRRSDATIPWDEDPDAERALDLSFEGREGDDMRAVGMQSDRIEWRVFVEYDPGAFDLETGVSHGWKETPRLRRLGISYTAPNLVLRSVDR